MTPGADGATPAAEWGRADADGTVYVRTAKGERPVGSWQAGDAEAGLAHFARRFADLATEADLLEQRLASGAGDPQATDRSARALRDSLPTVSAVGDLDGLGRHLETIIEAAAVRAGAKAAERAAARAKAVATKEALVVEAEQIAVRGGDWKAGGDRLRAMVEEWKAIRGVDRRTDEALWKRLRLARDAFTSNRSAHFAALGAERSQVKERKEALIRAAQTLSESTDWGPTAAKLKDLMREWKAAGRAARGVDDELWTRFRAAQDAFFANRTEVLRQRDGAESANLRAKEALVARLEALDPERDKAGADASMRRIQKEYDATGDAPRSTGRGLEERMRAAEQRIREALQATERPPPPANPLLDQMRDAAHKAEVAVEKARAAGDPRRTAEAEAALAARQQWLADAERATADR